MVTKAYTDDEFESLISQYDYKFQKGDLVKYTIEKITADKLILKRGEETKTFTREQ